jgi:hypothetical protein
VEGIPGGRAAASHEKAEGRLRRADHFETGVLYVLGLVALLRLR